MKHLLKLLLAAGFLAACSPSENYKAIRQEVLTDHDDVMMDSERAFKNKMQLDTINSSLDSLKKVNPDLDTLKENQQINVLRAELAHADDQMNSWMHAFDAEIGKKSNDEAVAYFKAEKKKVDDLDSVFKKVLKASDEYIQRFKK